MNELLTPGGGGFDSELESTSVRAKNIIRAALASGLSTFPTQLRNAQLDRGVSRIRWAAARSVNGGGEGPPSGAPRHARPCLGSCRRAHVARARPTARARARAQLDAYKAQAKKIVKNLNPNSPAKLRIDAGQSYFNYILAEGVCFLCLSGRSYDKRLAFQFLEDLKADFLAKYRDEVAGATRPYAFIKFDTVIQRTKRSYSDTRSQASMQRLNEELYEVQASDPSVPTPRRSAPCAGRGGPDGACGARAQAGDGRCEVRGAGGADTTKGHRSALWYAMLRAGHHDGES